LILISGALQRLSCTFENHGSIDTGIQRHKGIIPQPLKQQAVDVENRRFDSSLFESL
jgi:hypothetical protein